jgi:hypothetical protein
VKDPVKAIREYKKKGYRIELQVDSARRHYTINVVDQKFFKSFVVPDSQIPIQTLHAAIRGL